MRFDKDCEPSEFAKRVYEIVAQIPAGKVATYGQIASMLGKSRASRIVGAAMRNTPAHINIPCHRVVNKSGSMAPDFAFGGGGKQRNILEIEGVVFLDNGCTDMKQCLWDV